MKELFPTHYTLMLTGPPGVGKHDFCLDMVAYYLKKGDRVIYITTEKSPAQIEKVLGNFIDIEKYYDRIIFLDGFSWSIGGRYSWLRNNESHILSIDNPSNLNEIKVKLERAIEILGKPVRIVFDSLSPVFLHNHANDVIKFVQVLSSRVRTDYGLIIFTLQEGVHDPQVVNTLIYFVDGLLQMKFEENERLKRKLRVHHLKGIPISPKWRDFSLKEGFKIEDSISPSRRSLDGQDNDRRRRAGGSGSSQCHA